MEGKTYMTTPSTTGTQRLDPRPGIAVYSRSYLNIYDWFVLGFGNSVVWQCPTALLMSWYERHVSSRHLDVGVGTGYFLDRCHFPAAEPTIALLDLNEEALRFTAERIRRYRPTIHRADVLEPLTIAQAPFQSIAMNYLLHCLPGDMHYKGQAFAHLGALLAGDGVLFGSTILADRAMERRLSRTFLEFSNRKGIFSNRQDTLATLEAELARHFTSHEVVVHGCVALFAARR